MADDESTGPKHLTDHARKLRNEATPQERALWRLLSRYRPKFTRQLSIDPYTADLACREAKLIVEVDGSQHIDSRRDEGRTRFLQAEGWTVIRFWNRRWMRIPTAHGSGIPFLRARGQYKAERQRKG